MYKINSKILISLILILFLGTFFRIYKLEDYPIQLNHDEVSQLYDAISIATTARDIYGNFMPVIFESVHDFKSPFYTYITSLFYFIFGWSELIIRLPGAIFGSLIILAIYFFSLSLLKNQKIAILSAALTAIAPFELFFSRKSFENVAGIFFMLVGFSLLLTYLTNRTKTVWLYTGALVLAIASYTYFSHAIIIPLLLIFFILIFRASLINESEIKPGLLWMILILPLIFLVLTNPDARYRSQTVFITQDINLGERIRNVKIGNPFFDILLEQKTIFDYSFNRYLAQFDPIYIFGNGLDFTNQGALGVGPLMVVQLPFLILGALYLINIKEKNREKKFILVWIALGMLPSGLTFEPTSPHRSIMVFTMLNVICAAGLFWFFSKYRTRYLKIFVALAFFVNFVFFVHMYTVNFPHEKFLHLHYPFEEVSKFMWSEYQNFDQIVFDPLYGESAPVIGTAAHYYVGYFGNYPPKKMQQQYRLGQKEREVLFDKFSIRKINWSEDKDMKKTLIVASSWSIPVVNIEQSKILKIFYFLSGQPAFYAIKLD